VTEKIEEELKRLSVEIRLLEQTAEAITARLNMINAAMTELTYASITLEELEKEKGNAEILIPIGGDTYIKAKLENLDKVTVGIGAGVSIEKTPQETKEIINKRLENLEKARESLQQQLTQVLERINADREKVEELATDLKKGTLPKNVRET